MTPDERAELEAQGQTEDAIPASHIVSVEGVGFTQIEGRDMAYVDVVLSDGTRRGLLFEEAVANPLAAAILSASSGLHGVLAHKRGDDPRQIIGNAVEANWVNVAVLDPKSDQVVLQMVTENGANILYSLGRFAARSLAKRLGSVLGQGPARH